MFRGYVIDFVGEALCECGVEPESFTHISLVKLHDGIGGRVNAFLVSVQYKDRGFVRV